MTALQAATDRRERAHVAHGSGTTAHKTSHNATLLKGQARLVTLPPLWMIIKPLISLQHNAYYKPSCKDIINQTPPLVVIFPSPQSIHTVLVNT